MDLERRKFLRGAGLVAGAAALGSARETAASPIARLPSAQENGETLDVDEGQDLHAGMEQVNSWVYMEDGLREQLETYGDHFSFDPENGELRVTDTLDPTNAIQWSFVPQETAWLDVRSTATKEGFASLTFLYHKHSGVSGFLTVTRNLFTGRMESFSEERQEVNHTGPVTEKL